MCSWMPYFVMDALAKSILLFMEALRLEEIMYNSVIGSKPE